MKKRFTLIAVSLLLLLSIVFVLGYIYSDSIVGKILLKQNSEFLYTGVDVNRIEYSQTGSTILQLEIPFIGQDYPETQNNTNAQVVIDYENSVVNITENENQQDYTLDEFFRNNLIFQESFWDNVFTSNNLKMEESRDFWQITVFSSNLNTVFLQDLESLFRKDFESKKYKLGEVESSIDGNIDLEIYISKKDFLISKVTQKLNGEVNLVSTLGGEPIEELEKSIDIEDKTVRLKVKKYELVSDVTNFEVTREIPKNSLTIWLNSL